MSKLSVIVISYDMQRELPRTLYSLSSRFQHLVNADDYEVIVVDNGSEYQFKESEIKSFGSNFHYATVDQPSRSPALAMNTGAELAKADLMVLMVDGARIVTPGFLHHAITAFKLFPHMVVATTGWHLGDRPQQESIETGYDQQKEDELLRSIDWRSNGYKLFEISSLAPSSKGGCFLPIAESNALVVSKKHFAALNGFDLRFDSPGGGLVNLDFYQRSIANQQVKLVMLAGEASFHQIHGGISTNVSTVENQKRVKQWFDEYEQIRGKPFAMVSKNPVLFGEINPYALPYLAQSAKSACEQFKA